MGKRPASSKATRGASKGKKPASSSSSNPKTDKFRSQYNSLAVIAKGGPSKKAQNQDAIKKVAKDAVERQSLVDAISMLGTNESEINVKKKGANKITKGDDSVSIISGGSKLTTASFASVWSNCTNPSLNEFFQVWNPKLETHKDALAVIAGLSQSMTSSGIEQTDIEYAKTLIRIMSSPEIPSNVLTGVLLALTFVIRKISLDVVYQNLNLFYPALKNVMEEYHLSKKKTLIKCLIRCFACLSRAHPLGKKFIDSGLRKKINVAIRQYKVQDKISL